MFAPNESKAQLTSSKCNSLFDVTIDRDFKYGETKNVRYVYKILTRNFFLKKPMNFSETLGSYRLQQLSTNNRTTAEDVDVLS